MKLDTDRHTWGGDAECFMGINSYERLEHHSNNARLGKSAGYPRLPKIISIRHHLRKWRGPKQESSPLPIQKRLGRKERPSSLFCMGRGEDSHWRMAHFARCGAISFFFEIRHYSALFPNCALLESRSGLSYELIPMKHSAPPPLSVTDLSIRLHM